MPTNLLAQQVKNPAIVGLSGYSSSEFFGNIVGVVISALFVAGIILFMFKLISGGLGWLTAGADKGKVEDSKNTISQALLGIVILLSIFGIIYFIEQFLGFKITNFDISKLGVYY
jgi:hypothetical protein